MSSKANMGSMHRHGTLAAQRPATITRWRYVRATMAAWTAPSTGARTRRLRPMSRTGRAGNGVTLPTEKDIKDIAGRVCRAARPLPVEGIVAAGNGGSTRFSGNAISQNVRERSLSISIKVVDRGRVGRVVINQTDDGS